MSEICLHFIHLTYYYSFIIITINLVLNEHCSLKLLTFSSYLWFCLVQSNSAAVGYY